MSGRILEGIPEEVLGEIRGETHGGTPGWIAGEISGRISKDIPGEIHWLTSVGILERIPRYSLYNPFLEKSVDFGQIPPPASGFFVVYGQALEMWWWFFCTHDIENLCFKVC